MKFSAIDIRSNAIWLLLSRVFEDGILPSIKKESLVRMLIRQGADTLSAMAMSTEK